MRSARIVCKRAAGFAIGRPDSLAGGALLGRGGDRCWQAAPATCASRKAAASVPLEWIPFSPMQRGDGLPIEREGLLQLIRHKFQLGFPR